MKRINLIKNLKPKQKKLETILGRVDDFTDKKIIPFIDKVVDRAVLKCGDYINKTKKIGKHIYNHRGIYAGIVALGFYGLLTLKDINKPYKVEGELKSIIKPPVHVLSKNQITEPSRKIAKEISELYQKRKAQEVKEEIKAEPQIKESKVVKQTIKYDPNSIVDTLKQKGMNYDFESRDVIWNALTRHEGEYKGTASQNKVLLFNLKDKTKDAIEEIIIEYMNSKAPKKVEVSESPVIKSDMQIKKGTEIRFIEEKAESAIKDVAKQEIKPLDVKQDRGKISVVPEKRPNTLEQYVLKTDRHMKSDILLTKKVENWDFDPSKYRFFVDSESNPTAIVLRPINNDKLEFGKALGGESLYGEITAEKAEKLKDKILRDDMFNGTWSTLKILKNKQGEVVGYAFTPLPHITNESLENKVRLHNPDSIKFRIGYWY